jgi:hypothetical protein
MSSSSADYDDTATGPKWAGKSHTGAIGHLDHNRNRHWDREAGATGPRAKAGTSLGENRWPLRAFSFAEPKREVLGCTEGCMLAKKATVVL